MALYGINKRSGGRAKRELAAGVKTGNDLKQVYTIDFSQGGVKIGGAMLQLPLGAPVELFLDKKGEKIPFLGRIARKDGIYYINRIGRDANAFFVRITDERFSAFVKEAYQV